MATTSFSTTITVNARLPEAFAAIQDFRGWWSVEIEGRTDVLNETFFYHHKDVHLCKLRLVEQHYPDKLVYLVLDNEFSFTKDKTEWIGDRLVFELNSSGEQTSIVFTHDGLVPAYECYHVCRDAWTSYIHGSLKPFLETGQGKPNGKEGGLNEEMVKKWGLPAK